VATKTVKLWCENGKHHWRRPSQRGRKPANCPKHQPQPEVSEKTKPKTKMLWCENGEHKWKWERRGGFEPKNCPEHKPIKNNEEYEELHCQNGNHTWTRQRARGKKPVNCPLHGNTVKATGGLGAIKAKKTPKNGKEPILRGLGKIKAKKRTGLRGLREAALKRQRVEAITYVNESVQRYEAAAEEEREIFEKLDKLENKTKKSAKTQQKIEELREEWERAWRKLNNNYNTSHNVIAAKRSIING